MPKRKIWFIYNVSDDKLEEIKLDYNMNVIAFPTKQDVELSTFIYSNQQIISIPEENILKLIRREIKYSLGNKRKRRKKK